MQVIHVYLKGADCNTASFIGHQNNLHSWNALISTGDWSGEIVVDGLDRPVAILQPLSEVPYEIREFIDKQMIEK